MTSDPEPEPRVAARLCLVLGGARSGKSGFAQMLAEDSGLQPVYLATAAAWDDEMRERVARHRADRDGRWRTVEESVALVDVLEREASTRTVVVVDCLTLWLTNLMLGDRDLGQATAELFVVLPRLAGPVVFVSNEVGAGIVPDNALARRFRDEQGRLNQTLTRLCDTVVFVAAGLPVLLKPNAGPQVVIPNAAEPDGTFSEPHDRGSNARGA